MVLQPHTAVISLSICASFPDTFMDNAEQKYRLAGGDDSHSATQKRTIAVRDYSPESLTLNYEI